MAGKAVAKNEDDLHLSRVGVELIRLTFLEPAELTCQLIKIDSFVARCSRAFWKWKPAGGI